MQFNKHLFEAMLDETTTIIISAEDKTAEMSTAQNVTPPMIDAGVSALFQFGGISVDTDPVELAIAVYRAMVAAKLHAGASDIPYPTAQTSEDPQRVDQAVPDAHL